MKELTEKHLSMNALYFYDAVDIVLRKATEVKEICTMGLVGLLALSLSRYIVNQRLFQRKQC